MAAKSLPVFAPGHRRGGEGGLDLLFARAAAELVAHLRLQRLEEAVGGFERVDAGGVVADQPFLGAKAEPQRFGVGPVGGVEAFEDAVRQFEQLAGLAEAAPARRAADQRLPGRQRFVARRRGDRAGGAGRHQRGEIVGRGRLVAPRGDRPVEHAVEIEFRRLLDAVGRRIGPDADQAVGIALVDGQQPAHPLVEMERLDDDDLVAVAERVVAVGEIGQVSGEIGDDVAPRLCRPLSAHDRLFRLSARRRRREALARSGIISRIGRMTSRRTRVARWRRPANGDCMRPRLKRGFAADG